MDKSLIEKYKKEMLNMYRTAKPTLINTVATTQENNTVPPLSERTENTPENTSPPDNEIGNLVVTVTTLRSLYPLPNAKVTVFKGDANNMEVLATTYTDRSGRTQSVSLPAPKNRFSQESDYNGIPYSVYNISVTSEGFRENIHLNIPIFSGVTTIQRSNMMLLETAGVDKGPQVFDESEDYNL